MAIRMEYYSESDVTDTATVTDDNDYVTEEAPIASVTAEEESSRAICHKEAELAIEPATESGNRGDKTYRLDRKTTRLNFHVIPARVPVKAKRNSRNKICDVAIIPLLGSRRTSQIARAAIDHLGIKVDVENPIYRLDNSVSIQNSNVDAENPSFYSRIIGNNSLLIMYSDRTETILVYHPRWNVVLDKVYSTRGICILSYEQSTGILRQESLNYNNAIMYRRNGMILWKKPDSVKIVLPAGITHGRISTTRRLQPVQCFAVWSVESNDN